MKLRGAICAVLMYLSLDMSLPMMPGAFVFDLDDSVDAHTHRRGMTAVAELVVVPAPIGEALSQPPVRAEPVRAPRSRGEHHRCIVRNRLSPSADDSGPPSEDSH